LQFELLNDYAQPSVFAADKQAAGFSILPLAQSAFSPGSDQSHLFAG